MHDMTWMAFILDTFVNNSKAVYKEIDKLFIWLLQAFDIFKSCIEASERQHLK